MLGGLSVVTPGLGARSRQQVAQDDHLLPWLSEATRSLPVRRRSAPPNPVAFGPS